jgi:hypothetical protein
MIDTASDHEQIDTCRVKDESVPSKEGVDRAKVEDLSNSDSEEWEEIETRVVAVDCSCVHVLAQALKPPPLVDKTKKAFGQQSFAPGQPPIVSLSQSLAERLFDSKDCGKAMVSLKGKDDVGQPFWYNATVEPNVGTCIYLEVGQGMSESDESFDSDAELIDFL